MKETQVICLNAPLLEYGYQLQPGQLLTTLQGLDQGRVAALEYGWVQAKPAVIIGSHGIDLRLSKRQQPADIGR